MSTLILDETEVAATVDDFSALEQRILRAVELVRTERAAREQAEQTVARLKGDLEAQTSLLNESQETVTRLQGDLEAQTALLNESQEQVRNLETERDQVRERVEKMLKQLDEIAS